MSGSGDEDGNTVGVKERRARILCALEQSIGECLRKIDSERSPPGKRRSGSTSSLPDIKRWYRTSGVTSGRCTARMYPETAVLGSGLSPLLREVLLLGTEARALCALRSCLRGVRPSGGRLPTRHRGHTERDRVRRYRPCRGRRRSRPFRSPGRRQRGSPLVVLLVGPA